MSTHSQETEIVLSWLRSNTLAAEWAAAVVENGDPAAASDRLRVHVARFMPDDLAPFYGRLLRVALDAVDYEIVAGALVDGGAGG